MFIILFTVLLLSCEQPTGPSRSFTSSVQSIESDRVIIEYANRGDVPVLVAQVNVYIYFDDTTMRADDFTVYNVAPGYESTYTFIFADKTPVSANCNHTAAFQY